MEWGCSAALAVVLFFFSWSVVFVPLLVQIRDGPSVDCEGGCAFHHLVCVPFPHPTQHGPFSHVMPNDVKFDGRAAFQDAVSAGFFLDLDGLLVLVTDDMSSSPHWNVSEFQASCGSVDPGNSQRGKEDTKSKATSQSLLISSIPQVWIECFGDKSLFSVFYWVLAGVVASAMKTMQMMPFELQAAAAFAWLFPFTGLGEKALDLIGLVVQMVKAAAAFFGHITLVGLIAVFSLSNWCTGFCTAVFGSREFLTQVGTEATQQLGSCTIVVTSAAAQALEIAAPALEGVLLTLEGNRCIGDGAVRCVSLTLRARGLLRGAHVLGLRMLLDEATRLGADRVLVQKSGYFGRSAAPSARDLDLIRRSAAVGARAALDGVSGVAGMDEDHGVEMSMIAFPRIKGVKPQSVQPKELAHWCWPIFNSLHAACKYGQTCAKSYTSAPPPPPPPHKHTHTHTHHQSTKVQKLPTPVGRLARTLSLAGGHAGRATLGAPQRGGDGSDGPARFCATSGWRSR